MPTYQSAVSIHVHEVPGGSLRCEATLLEALHAHAHEILLLERRDLPLLHPPLAQLLNDFVRARQHKLALEVAPGLLEVIRYQRRQAFVGGKGK